MSYNEPGMGCPFDYRLIRTPYLVLPQARDPSDAYGMASALRGNAAGDGRHRYVHPELHRPEG
jgi:hypothetical protein